MPSILRSGSERQTHHDLKIDSTLMLLRKLRKEEATDELGLNTDKGTPCRLSSLHPWSCSVIRGIPLFVLPSSVVLLCHPWDPPPFVLPSSVVTCWRAGRRERRSGRLGLHDSGATARSVAVTRLGKRVHRSVSGVAWHQLEGWISPPSTPPHNVAGLRSLRCQAVCAGNVAGRGHVTSCQACLDQVLVVVNSPVCWPWVSTCQAPSSCAPPGWCGGREVLQASSAALA